MTSSTIRERIIREVEYGQVVFGGPAKERRKELRGQRDLWDADRDLLPPDMACEFAEDTVLGACLADEAYLEQAAGRLSPEDFSMEWRSKAWRLMAALHRSKEPVNIVTVLPLLVEEFDVFTSLFRTMGERRNPYAADYVGIVHCFAEGRRLVEHALTREEGPSAGSLWSGAGAS